MIWVGFGFASGFVSESGTQKNRGWFRNTSFRIHNTGKKGTVLLGGFADQFKGRVYLKTEDDDEKDAVGCQQDSRLLYCAAVAEKAKNQENNNM